MDSEVPGPSNRTNEIVDEVLDTDNSDDPVQNIVDAEPSDDEAGDSTDYDSDDATDIDITPPTWCISTAGMRPIEFVKEDTLLVPIPGNGTPFDFFSMLLEDKFLEDIVNFTNKYAFEEVFAKPDLTPNSRINRWKELTVSELKVFIGLLFHTGTIKLNRLKDYWKTDSLFNLKIFSSTMSRDRFLLILRCLHFSQVQRQNAPVDPLQKIMYVVNYFNSKMEKTYYPQKELSLDEEMILWRGRLQFRQYIKGKRHKYGIKLYTLTEHQGLILKFAIYAGAADKVLGGKGHTEKVVLHLLKEKLGHGHSVYMDNFYNSYSLAQKLLAQKTYCTGTLRSDRKFIPEDVKVAKLKKGETIERYGNSVMVAKWRDKRVVLYISTEFENSLVEFNDKRQHTKKKPLPIIKYNAHMSGVDRADQMMAYYPCERKTIRWYKKIFVHVLQMLLLNSHAFHNMYKPKISFYDFRLEVIKALLPSESIETPPQKKARHDAHKLEKVTERDHRNRLRRKNCKMCWKKGKEFKTPYFCATCPENPALCMGDCFEQYHNNL